MELQEKWQKDLDLSLQVTWVLTENSQSVFWSYWIPTGGEVGRMKRAYLFFSSSLSLRYTHLPTSFKYRHYLNKRPYSIINASKNLFKEPGLTLKSVNIPFPVTAVANCCCNAVSQVQSCKNIMNQTFTPKACLITGVFYMQDLGLFFSDRWNHFLLAILVIYEPGIAIFILHWDTAEYQ